MLLVKNGEVPAQYPLVEFVGYEWNKEQKEDLNVTLIPIMKHRIMELRKLHSLYGLH